MATLGEIDTLAKQYADARDSLSATVRDLKDKQEALLRQYLPGIKRQVGIAAAKRHDLKNAIDVSRSVFKQPRTYILHGIKVGLQKGSGKIEWEKDETDRIVRLIEKYFPEQVELLIQTKKTPIKKALGNLAVSDLKKLGIEVDDTGDAIVIKPTDGQIEKLVDKLLKENSEDEAEEEAA